MPFIRGTRYATLARGAARNASPTITVPGAQSATSNVALAITGISISDPESNDQTVSLSVSHGTFSLASTTGLSFSVGDGTADASMTFSGSLANCNTAIATLTYTSTTDYSGSDTLTINSTDAGGLTATQKTVAITVTWTPASLTTALLAWFDPTPSTGVYSDAGTTVAVLNDPVYQWSARSGTGSITASQSTLANRPIASQGANGKWFFTYDGGNDALRSSYSSAFARDITVAAQWKQIDPSNTHDSYPAIITKENNTSQKGWLLGLKGTTRQFGVTSPFVASIAYNASDSADATWLRGAMTISSGTNADFTVYINNSSVATATANGFGQHQAGDTLQIGEVSTAGSGSWKGGIGHIVLVNGVLSSDRLALLDTYLSNEMPT